MEPRAWGTSKGCFCLCPDPQKAGSTTCIPSPQCPQPARPRASLASPHMPRQLGCEGAPGRWPPGRCCDALCQPASSCVSDTASVASEAVNVHEGGLAQGLAPRSGSAESLDRAAVL